MQKRISTDRALSEFGISCLHEEMPNGERRFRLGRESGGGYVLTLSGKRGAWQNSHFHKHISEFYLVESQWLAMAFLDVDDKSFKLSFLRQGESCLIKPYVPHNVFMPSGGTVHTIKMNSVVVGDWFPSCELDAITKLISERQLHESLSERTCR